VKKLGTGESKSSSKKLPAKTAGSSKTAGTAKSANVKVALPRPLSVKEKAVLEFLEIYLSREGVSPTYQEICNHFGFASLNSVQRYLKQLEFKGYIQLPWANQKRAITVLHPSSTVQTAMQSSIESSSTAFATQRISNVVSMIQPPSQSENFSLPLLGRVAAGAPIEAYEHDEFIDVPASLVRHADRTYALRVQGQSMIEDGILDGDVILVQRQSSASNGEIVVAMIGEEATVKRFYRQPQDRQIELRPANSTMESMWFDSSEVQIRGIVVGLIRKFM
jgi:repressor LexA